ncbi:MAG TPA: 16S rRNA (cytidine(1402)-2'-O)-methyltransferase, partial [Nocardioides sp.]|nr:16S rRNA (cytidine(1402)-2'-O)-methyltransferase [Nocardioides sp.]
KTHEEVRRGPLAELVDWAEAGVRGEVTIVVSGAQPRATVESDPDSLRAAVAALEQDGLSRKDAIAAVASASAVPKRTVYQAVHVKGEADE